MYKKKVSLIFFSIAFLMFVLLMLQLRFIVVNCLIDGVSIKADVVNVEMGVGTTRASVKSWTKYKPTYRYTYNNMEYTIESNVSTDRKFEVGDTATIVISKNNPSKLVSDYKWLIVTSIVCIVFTIICIWFGIILIN